MVITRGGGGGLDNLGGLGSVYQDCNGKTPLSQLLQPPRSHSPEQSERLNPRIQLMADVFPQVNTRSKQREDLDDDLDYVSSFKLCAGRMEINANRIRKSLVSKCGKLM